MTDVIATDSAADEKATLFCPRCGYSDPWDGHWLPTSDPHRLRCPKCGSTVG